jgi:hypothetical protein
MILPPPIGLLSQDDRAANMNPIGDLVILLPGITGSVLADVNGHDLWSPSADSIWQALTTNGNGMEALRLPPNGDPQGITAPRLIPDITIIPGFIKIAGYTQIENYLIGQLGLKRETNYFPYPYDWRLDNRVNAQRLGDQALGWLNDWRQITNNPGAKLILIAHSMGGLIARYFLECLGGWKDTRMLVTLGTPHQGSLNAVDVLVHGMKKAIGPLGFDFSPLLRSYPSVYQLLPIYRCIEIGSSELVHVDEAAAQRLLPSIDEKKAREGRAFHLEIQQAQAANAKDPDYGQNAYRLVPLVGNEQPTFQSASVDQGLVTMLRHLNGKDDSGDGTVPRIAAIPIELENMQREVFCAEMHASLQHNQVTLNQLRGLLLKPETNLANYRAEFPISLSLDLDDVVLPGEGFRLRARTSERAPRIEVEMSHLARPETYREVLRHTSDSDWQYGEFSLPPGTWRVRVSAAGATPVVDYVIVASEAGGTGQTSKD